MKKKIVTISILTSLLFLLIPTTYAYMGLSSSYKLDVADITNSSGSGTSTGYSLSAGVTGDSFDGTGSSTNYRLCSGYVEESYNGSGCGGVTPPTPPTPPSTGGGGSGWRPYTQQIVQTQETVFTQELPPTQQIQPTQEVQPAQEATPQTQEALATAGQPAPQKPVQPTRHVYLSPEEKQLLADVWCSENTCVDNPVTILHPSAEEVGIYFTRPWIIWLSVLLIILTAFLAGLYASARYQLHELQHSHRTSTKRMFKHGKRKK